MDQLLEQFFRVDHYYREALKLQAEFAAPLEHQETIVNNQIQYFEDKTYHEDVLRQIESLREAQRGFNKSHEILLDDLSRQLRRLEVRIIQRDYDNYEKRQWESHELLELNNMLSPSFNQFMVNKIMNYGEWQFAGADINPLDGRWLRYLVSADPLYIITDNEDIKKACHGQFNDYFANHRLRDYESLGHLPQYQLSLVIGINLFEYMPLDPMKSWFKAVHRALKPGGRFLFTYNDCEHRASLELIDNEFRCYNTNSIMRYMAHGYGFDVLDYGHENGVWSWMEIKKPGELTSGKRSGAISELIKI